MPYEHQHQYRHILEFSFCLGKKRKIIIIAVKTTATQTFSFFCWEKFTIIQLKATNVRLSSLRMLLHKKVEASCFFPLKMAISFLRLSKVRQSLKGLVRSIFLMFLCKGCENHERQPFFVRGLLAPRMPRGFTWVCISSACVHVTYIHLVCSSGCVQCLSACVAAVCVQVYVCLGCGYGIQVLHQAL